MEHRLVSRVRRHRECLLDVIERQGVRAKSGGPIGGTAEGDPSLGGEGIGLRPGRCREIRVPIVRRQDPGQLLAVERLEVPRGGEVARPAILLREGLVGDLADQPLDEDILAALRRSRVVLECQDLAPNEASKPGLEGDLRVPGERLECRGSEAEAEHGRVLDQGTIGRGQPVDPGADEAAQRLGDGELVDLALEPEAVAVGDQATVVDEHPDGLDGKERDPVRSLDHLAHERPGQTRDDAFKE